MQRRAWQLAHAPSEKEEALFRGEDFELLRHSNLLHLVEGDAALLPDVELVASEGHTAGLQLPRFQGDRMHLTWCGDVIPTHAHLRWAWVAAYDLLPVTTIEEKKVLLAEALEDGGVLAFEHDPVMAACRLREDEDGRPVFREAVEMSSAGVRGRPVVRKSMLEPKVKISRRGAERLQGGHLWIYRSDVDHAPAALEPGDVVALVDGRGRFLAKAFWSARSQIALRVVTRDEEPMDEAFFAAAPVRCHRRAARGSSATTRSSGSSTGRRTSSPASWWTATATPPSSRPSSPPPIGERRCSPTSSRARSRSAPSWSATTSASASSRGSRRRRA